MPGIRILPEIISNQIAAGEVVERPASVVKELVENCLDAQATSILVETVNGGKSLIRVSDNGQGMSRDDALLSIERYATSKIYTASDLFSIATMGFRGEALPSISSVSRLTLVTRTANSDVATRIDMAGGKLVRVSDAGAPVGTLVEVAQLFFNTPARRKFLKTETTENSHIADTVAGIALGNPFIQFRLVFGNQLQKTFSASENAITRAINVLGSGVHHKLYPVDFTDGMISVSGFVAGPMVTRSTASRIYLYVNKRLIRDRGLISAVFRGYDGRIMKQRFPYAVIFLDLPPDQVDVNVHPAKREVRFSDSAKVFQAVSAAVSSALTIAGKNDPGYARADSFNHPRPSMVHEKPTRRFEFSPLPESSQVNESALPFSRSEVSEPKPVDPDIISGRDTATGRIDDAHKSAAGPDDAPAQCPPMVIGQVLGTYIVAESDQGLVLIDQHAAHERIVYERLKQRFEILSVTSQDLLVPETIELGFREADRLTRMLEDLSAIGIRIEPFGGTTFVIKSVPGIIDQKEVSALVMDILDVGQDTAGPFSKEKWQDECLARMACHDAIRANHVLTVREMEKLVTDLGQCHQSMHCPHGRPVMLLWSRADLEKLFKRIT